MTKNVKTEWLMVCALFWATASVTGCGGVEGSDSIDAEPSSVAAIESALNQDIGSAVGSPVLSSNTCGAANEYTPGCGSSKASDHSYLWRAPAAGSYTFTTTGAGFDTILQLYDWPSLTSLGCNDDSNGTLQSSMTVEFQAGQQAIIVVDGYSSNCGSFNLHIKGPRVSNQPYVGRYWSLQSYNYTLQYARHRNSLGYISTISSFSNSVDKLDATFEIVNGLADPGCISFNSRNYPGSYLRHNTYRLRMDGYDGSDLFRRDATFCLKSGLAHGAAMSFESYNLPGHYIRHRDGALWVEAGGGDVYLSDATFRIVAPWAP